MNSSTEYRKENTVTISDLFQNMQLSSAKYSHSSLAQHWLKACNYFGGYVNGNWVSRPETTSPNITDVNYGDICVTFEIPSDDFFKQTVEISRKGSIEWKKYKAAEKSKILYKIAESINHHSNLISGVANLTVPGRIREKHNVPYLIESFKYCAGLVGDEKLCEGWEPTGLVGLIISEGDDPMLVSPLWRISSLLAAGNAVLVLDQSNTLSSFLLAEILHSAGLPAGLLNVLPWKEDSSTALPHLDKVIYFEHQKVTFNMEYYQHNEILCCKQSAVFVYESADLDAASDGIFDILGFPDYKDVWPTCQVYLQESIAEKFTKLLAEKIHSYIASESPNKLLAFHILGSKVVTNQSKKEEIDRRAPAIYIEKFRTVKESIAMFNTDKRGPDVSVFTEEMYLALEVAHKLKTGTVWINSQNLFEPSVSHSSIYLGGNSVLGGKEGFYSHLTIFGSDKDLKWDSTSYGASTHNLNSYPLGSKEETKIGSMKLYIGGSFSKSSDEKVYAVHNIAYGPCAYVACANKSDVEKAISSASSSQPNWEKLSKAKRSDILRKVYDGLKKRKQEFLSDLWTVTGLKKNVCATEVDTAANLIFFWANYIVHFEGCVTETRMYGKVFQERYPLGVIGIQCPERWPLLSFVSLVTPAVVFGNSVVVIASEMYPTLALKMCEIFQAAGIPAGVLNVICGDRAYLTRHLACHLSIDAMWWSLDGASFIEDSCREVPLKKIFCCKDMINDLDEAKKLKFVFESTYSKAVYMPMGSGFTD